MAAGKGVIISSTIKEAKVSIKENAGTKKNSVRPVQKF
ncbi:MAG: hypothetical protein U5K54_10445 [Cytophagales bacterium]|nr:hypothetical protein [Cytophagales bacterium]